MTTRRRFFSVFGAGAIAGCVTNGAPSIAAQPAPPLLSPIARALPAVFTLFGPVQRQAVLGADGFIVPAEWHFPGSALTASTALIRFDLNPPTIVWAIARLIWATSSVAQQARFVHFDDGPANIAQLGPIITGSGRGQPDNHVINITPQLNALRGGPYKNVGYQLHGDGGPLNVYGVRIELAWELP